MRPKPDHLGPEYGAPFADAQVVTTYRHRPPYPDGVFAILTSLIVDEPRAVLDAGAGRGEIARALARRVARVDAVEPAAGMIAQGRLSPGGDQPNLTWVEGFAEDAPLHPPYALIVAAQSLHWMD